MPSWMQSAKAPGGPPVPRGPVETSDPVALRSASMTPDNSGQSEPGCRFRRRGYSSHRLVDGVHVERGKGREMKNKKNVSHSDQPNGWSPHPGLLGVGIAYSLPACLVAQADENGRNVLFLQKSDRAGFRGGNKKEALFFLYCIKCNKKYMCPSLGLEINATKTKHIPHFLY